MEDKDQIALSRDQVTEIARDIAWGLICDVRDAETADLLRQLNAAEAVATRAREKYMQACAYTEVYNTILYPKPKSPVQVRDVINKVLHRPE